MTPESISDMAFTRMEGKLSKRTPILTIVPIMAGWCNDFFIYKYLLGEAPPSPGTIRLLANFDFAEKFILSILTAVFLIAALKRFQEVGNRFAGEWLGITVLALYAFESAMRMNGTFGWMRNEVLRYQLAAAMGLRFTYWSCLPFGGILLCVFTRLLWGVGKSWLGRRLAMSDKPFEGE